MSNQPDQVRLVKILGSALLVMTEAMVKTGYSFLSANFLPDAGLNDLQGFIDWLRRTPCFVPGGKGDGTPSIHHVSCYGTGMVTNPWVARTANGDAGNPTLLLILLDFPLIVNKGNRGCI
ncbi:hypothetical protein TSUD_141820 [Trifolium subterraneum]|uniref:Uncharacterized protein n=1 Tax=Trifolium subterraneum TaxID=3900 RepID=A0A2Z6LJU7_TRISU|nr:hypothetical protein TSUD_141820 [Trifolium subterraneum]